jgi:ubiquinone/menaquinone biosynthesis C-methylase UbiE
MADSNQQGKSGEHSRHIAEMVKYYASTASDYNHWHADLSVKGSHNFAVSHLLAVVKANGYKNVLDVCCGTGRATKACLEHGIEAHGVDISPELINEGIRQWGLPATALTCADATQLPFADKHFDVSCVLGALHHSAVPERIIEEMLRVTRHAMIISDSGNQLAGGVKTILQKLGLFNVVYRMIFHRAPRTTRRASVSATDGPAYVFSIEEVLPLVRARFNLIKTYQFYNLGSSEVVSGLLPRLFADRVVAVARSR